MERLAELGISKQRFAQIGGPGRSTAWQLQAAAGTRPAPKPCTASTTFANCRPGSSLQVLRGGKPTPRGNLVSPYRAVVPLNAAFDLLVQTKARLQRQDQAIEQVLSDVERVMSQISVVISDLEDPRLYPPRSAGGAPVSVGVGSEHLLWNRSRRRGSAAGAGRGGKRWDGCTRRSRRSTARGWRSRLSGPPNSARRSSRSRADPFGGREQKRPGDGHPRGVATGLAGRTRQKQPDFETSVRLSATAMETAREAVVRNTTCTTESHTRRGRRRDPARPGQRRAVGETLDGLPLPRRGGHRRHQ